MGILDVEVQGKEGGRPGQIRAGKAEENPDGE